MKHIIIVSKSALNQLVELLVNEVIPPAHTRCEVIRFHCFSNII